MIMDKKNIISIYIDKIVLRNWIMESSCREVTGLSIREPGSSFRVLNGSFIGSPCHFLWELIDISYLLFY